MADPIVVPIAGARPIEASFAAVNNAQLYYEVYGEGEPILLIPGLGSHHLGWSDGIPLFASEFQVIVFDPRGTGQSSSIEETNLTVSIMAEDVVGLLDALAIDMAHIYGVSMGGMVAQEVALRYPERVRSLILGATSPGGAGRTFPRGWETAVAVFQADIARDFVANFQKPPEYPAVAPEVVVAQFQAVALHDTYDRLPSVRLPTLVLHGTNDPLIPVNNGKILAERIPGAELLLLEGARHSYRSEPGDASDAAVLQFLVAQSEAIGRE